MSSWTHERATGLISDYVREQVLADFRGFEESKVLERTQVIRDHNGRVIGLDSTGSDTSPDGLVLYSYDDAGQLVGAVQHPTCGSGSTQPESWYASASLLSIVLTGLNARLQALVFWR